MLICHMGIGSTLPGSRSWLVNRLKRKLDVEAWGAGWVMPGKQDAAAHWDCAGSPVMMTLYEPTSLAKRLGDEFA